MSENSNIQELLALRAALGFTQSRMAHEIDISLREYQAYEWGEAEIPYIYLRALERIAFLYAVRHQDPMLLPPKMREEALYIGRMVATGA